MTSPLRLFDAHNHEHDARLDPHREAIAAALTGIGRAGAVVNGTREEDWERVARHADRDPRIIPSFGLHPWFIRDRGADWLAILTQRIDACARAGVGEIGLDAWIPDHDLAAQREVFVAQLQLASERNRPASIHCIQAWGALMDTLRAAPLPERGFLLHAYGGPAEMVAPFAKLGAYFSFSPAHLAPRKHARREVFRHIPAERLLVETDAPDMSPPVEYTRFPLPVDPEGRVLNHPASLAVACEELARLRAWPVGQLAAVTEENFRRLFG